MLCSPHCSCCCRVQSRFLEVQEEEAKARTALAASAAADGDEDEGSTEEQITHAQVELAFSKLVEVSARLARHLESVRAVVRFAAAFDHPQQLPADDSDSDTEL